MDSTALLEREKTGFRSTASEAAPEPLAKIPVALLTAGRDRPYVFGLVPALVAKAAVLDLIGSNELECPDFHANPAIHFMNLRGDYQPDPNLRRRMMRVLRYYARLVRYAATAQPKIFHILWNNKFEAFDRTLLMLYYKALGKKVVFTAHNVNARRRDLGDSWLNRFTLRTQYRLTDHIFVHTEKMKQELSEEFAVPQRKVTVIPFGINNSVPNTELTPREARQRLGIGERDKAILFFGRITPYKGLEYLAEAFHRVAAHDPSYRLVIAGVPERCEEYWTGVQKTLQKEIEQGRVLLHAHFVPDEQTEVYFKAADVLALPYRHIYQSGVLFLGHGFGLPALAADVGAMKDDIVEGETGFSFRPEDTDDLARAIEQYFASPLYTELEQRRPEIQAFSEERHSWDIVGRKTRVVYEGMLPKPNICDPVESTLSSNRVNVPTSS